MCIPFPIWKLEMAAPALRVPPARPERRRSRAARGRRHSPLRDWCEYGALRAVAFVLGALPMSIALCVGEAAAFVAWLTARPLRRIGMRNLAIAFPEKSIPERRRILRGSFLNLGRMAAEMVRFPRLTDAELRRMVRFTDEAWWQEAITAERDTGGLILSGHFGNWELLVFAHGMRGHPVHLVHRAIANPLVDRWLEQVRSRAGTMLVRKRQAAGEVLRALHEHGLLVLPFDQNSTRGLGVFVDFFGLAASTNSGMARIALRSGAPVVPAFIVRQGRRAEHVVHVLPLMRVERTGDMAEDVRRATQAFSDVFEAMVRRYPEQWLWMHKRWKTRPAGEPRIY